VSPYPREVMERFHGSAEQLAAGSVGARPASWDSIMIVDPDPTWPDRYRAAALTIRGVLGELAVTVDHVGSTAVPGLPAKPVIDIDLTIEDTADELRYLPVLAGLGYRLVLREPWWYGHRMLLSRAEDTNLHVWPVGAPEPVRHLLFRDWLRTHPEDRELYATTKRHLAEATGRGPAEYSLAKNDVIDDIVRRIFSDNVA